MNKTRTRSWLEFLTIYVGFITAIYLFVDQNKLLFFGFLIIGIATKAIYDLTGCSPLELLLKLPDKYLRK